MPYSFALAATLLLALPPLAASSTPGEHAGLAARSATPARLPAPLTSFGAAALDGRLFVFGGHSGAPHVYDREHQSGDLLALELGRPQAWTLLDRRSRGLQSVAMAADARHVYAVGGMEAANAWPEDASLRSIREARRFDPATGVWSALPDLPTARSSHALAIAGHHLYAVGGWTLVDAGLRTGGEPCRDVAILDLSKPEAGWSLAPVPFARRAVAAAAIGTTLAVLGGMESDGAPSRRVDLCELDSGVWRQGPELPEEGFGAAAVSFDGRLLASLPSGGVFELDLEAGVWQPRAQLSFPRRFHQVVVDGGALYAVGGTIGSRGAGQGVVHVERVNLEGPSASEWSSARVSTPAAARNRQAMCLRGDSLYFAGGNRGTRQHDFAPEQFSTEAWRLDLASLNWTRLADLPSPVQSSAMIELDAGRLLLVGGFAPSADGARSSAQAWIYDLEADEWSPTAPLRVPRTQFALLDEAAAHWAIGGMDFDPTLEGSARFRLPLSIERRACDPSASPCEFVAAPWAMPRERRAFGAVLHAGRAYVVGGMAAEFEPVAECESIDLRDGTVERCASPRAPRISPQWVALGVGADARFYLVGGSRPDGAGEPTADRSIEVFDPSTGRWSVAAEDVGFDTAHLRAFAHRDRLLMVSTQGGPEAGARLCWFDPRGRRSTADLK